MCDLKNITIFIYICCVGCVLAKDCDPNYKLPKWESYDSEPPGYLRLGAVPEVAAALEAQVENRRENFTLTLLANPFVKDENNCPPAASSYHDLRKFHKSRNVIKGDDESESIFFGNIFTGCYYAEMTNAEGKKWLWDPVFYNTNYHYHDTMLKCKKFEVLPENAEFSNQLKVELDVPLTCLEVRCQLLELSKITQKTINDLTSGRIPVSQDCSVKNIGNGKLPEVNCTISDPSQIGLTLSATPARENDEDEGWSTVITWDFLNKDGASYYAFFKQYHRGTCNISYSDLMTWQPVVNFSWIVHGLLNGTHDDVFGYTNLRDNSNLHSKILATPSVWFSRPLDSN